MREAIGSTLLLKIAIVFLVIFIGFLAIALNYGKTFRIKNALVNYVEQNEGISDINEFNNYARRLGHIRSKNPFVCYYNTSRGYYYKITVNVMFLIPLVGNVLEIPINGETRIIDSGRIYNGEVAIDKSIKECELGD